MSVFKGSPGTPGRSLGPTRSGYINGKFRTLPVAEYNAKEAKMLQARDREVFEESLPRNPPGRPPKPVPPPEPLPSPAQLNGSTQLKRHYSYGAMRHSANKKVISHKRGRKCTVCTSPDRASIELLFTRKTNISAIARQYPDLNEDAINRHLKNHVTEIHKELNFKLHKSPDKQQKVLEMAEEGEFSLLTQLARARSILWDLIDLAHEGGDASTVARLMSQLHANLTLTGQKTGELRREARTQTINIATSPEFLAYQSDIVSVMSGADVPVHVQRDLARKMRAFELAHSQRLVEARNATIDAEPVAEPVEPE